MDPEGTNFGNKGIDVAICSEERKLSWIQDEKHTFMLMKLEACRDELD